MGFKHFPSHNEVCFEIGKRVETSSIGKDFLYYYGEDIKGKWLMDHGISEAHDAFGKETQ